MGKVQVPKKWKAFSNKSARRKMALAVLEALGDASEDEIKQAYRKLVKQYHPDRLGELTSNKRISPIVSWKYKKLTKNYSSIIAFIVDLPLISIHILLENYFSAYILFKKVTIVLDLSY